MARYKKIPVSELVVDHAYQRPLDERRVARMVKDFRPEMLGTLEVSRHNGKCAVFDGQHRLAVARAVGLDALPCLVHEQMGRPEEAGLFYLLQRDRKAIHPVQAFKARCVAGEEVATEIRSIAEDAGYAIDFNRDARTFSAVKTVERVYKRHNLTETLELLRIWDGDLGATDAMFIDGASLFQQGYGHRLTSATRSKLRGVSAAVIVRNATSRQIREVGWSNGKNRAAYVLTELRKVADLSGRPRDPKKKVEAA